MVPLVTKDFRRTTLRPRHRPIVRALAEALFSPAGGAARSHSLSIWLNGVYSAVHVLAAAFPGIGHEHRRLAKNIPNHAFFGGMVHDDGGGQVRRVSR